MSATEPEDPVAALRRSARADTSAGVEDWLRRRQPALLDRIRRMMSKEARSVLESSDLLQETWADILDGSASFGPGDEERFLRWATSVAQRNLCDQLRRRRQALLESVTGCLDTNTPSRDAARRDQDDIVRLAIESLPADHATVIDLRDLRHLSFEAIAAHLGRSVNAAQLLHARAMTRLGRVLRTRLEQA